MRFEERELTPWGEQVSASELVEGSVYFDVSYAESDLLIPTLEPFVFIGRNLEADDRGRVYFQDFHSYKQGVRYGPDTQPGDATFYVFREKGAIDMYEYERALDELMRCSMRLKKAYPSLAVARSAKRIPEAKPTATPAQRYIKFEDEALHAALLRELDHDKVPYTVSAEGLVLFSESDSLAVGAVAHRVRDKEFSGYFIMCRSAKEAEPYRAAFTDAGLRFVVEHNERGTALFVPRADKQHHEQIMIRVLENMPDDE